MTGSGPVRKRLRSMAHSVARHPSITIVLLIVLVGSALVAVGPESSTTAALVLGVVVLAVVLLVVLLAVNLSGSDPDAERRASEAIGADPAGPDPASVALLGRWLRRSRHFRFVGGLAGFILQFGLATNGPSWASLTIGVFGGIAAGGALAEVHSWRRRSGPRVADLARRRLRDYARPVDLAAVSAIAVVAIALLAWGWIDGGSATGAVAAATALAVVGALAVMLRLIVLRPRPALDPTLRQADELMRRLAATQGFTRPAIALGASLVAVALDRAGAGDGAVGVLSLAAVAWYWTSRQTSTGLRRAALR